MPSPDSTYQLVKELFKNDQGNPLELSPSQINITNCVFKRKSDDGKRNIHCISFTRFGKSLSVAIGVLLRVSTFAEKWAIVAPDDKKAKIIMSYIIQHIFDNEYTMEKFRIDKNENMERIRRERSKSKLTFKVGDRIGEVFVLSAQEKLQQNPMDALMGMGASSVVIDESSLIDDIKHTAILRMLGDSPDPFLFEIGNPFRLNHFFVAVKDKTYHHINIDYKIGLKEGRITQEQVNRMRKKPLFGVLYENKFPTEAQMDKEGWIQLLSYKELQDAKKRTVQSTGIERLGADVAEGGDENVITGRTLNYARLIHRDNQPDLMKTAGTIRGYIVSEGILPKNVFIDAIGDGSGVVSRIREKNDMVWGVKGSETADDPVKFKNRKAEHYWRTREWIRTGGCLEDIEAWDELLEIKYRIISSEGKIEILPKRKMLKSPNVAESLALTFYRSDEHDQSIDLSPPQTPPGSY